MDSSRSAEGATAAEGAGPASGPAPGSAPGDTAAEGRSLHARSFKLRFASQREQGRSYVSLVKPLGLPATVTGKFYVREQAGAGDAERERRALSRIHDMFGRGPRDKYPAPVTSSQVVGWHAAGAARPDARLSHHIRDSAWLKARLCVLAADDKLKQR
ncbi:uncharacterized protein LOC135116796 [Helicoverpa armigera]|uniref:uncharacterized protein LOC135116796 n=1 Tax=Helicoverpa armigera TaxID=29058 RepID=UPI000B3A55D7